MKEKKSAYPKSEYQKGREDMVERIITRIIVGFIILMGMSFYIGGIYVIANGPNPILSIPFAVILFFPVRIILKGAIGVWRKE